MTARQIPLADLHREHGAKFGLFAGFDMPIQYPMGLKAEHLHCRASASLFDVSHMGQIRVTASSPEALSQWLEAVLPLDFQGWPVGQQRYSLLLNDQGGIEDDLMAVWLGHEVRLVVNAGNRDADFARMQRLAPNLRFEWVDAALIALQGPRAEAVLAALDARAVELCFMEAAELNLLGASCFTTRSGYTGEDGYEISIPTQDAERVVRALMAAEGVAWAGLGARDTLRLEAGLPLHGSDMTPLVTPVEAGLTFGIASARRPAGAKAGGYPGAQAIGAQWGQPSKRLLAFTSKEPVPIRAHAVIVLASGDVVGEVTSGTVSPSLGYPILMAMVHSEAAGQPLFAVVRDKRLALSAAKLPFVPKRYKRAQ